MKKLNYILSALLLAGMFSMTSCKNEVDDVFDKTSAERLNASVDYFFNALTDKGGKWQFEYFSNETEQGYVYIFTFNKDGSVRISGNNPFINRSINGPDSPGTLYRSEVSLWQIITDDGPVLSLNSYNPAFHLFATPEDIPGTDANETGYGHNGDYEFNLMRYTGDSLIVNGKKRGLDLVFTRLDESTDDEVYLQHVVALADSFFNAKIPNTFLTLPDGSRYMIRNASTLLPELCPEYTHEVIGDKDTIIAGSWTYYGVGYNAIITPSGFSFMKPIGLGADSSKLHYVHHFNLQPDGSLLCREDGVSKITADTLNKMFFERTIGWSLDMTKSKGELANSISEAVAGVKARYSNRSFTGINILVTKKTFTALPNVRSLQFSIKSGSSTNNMTMGIKPVRIGSDEFRIEFTGQQDRNTPTFLAAVPALKALADKFASTTFKIKPNSMLAPTIVTLEDANDPNSSITFNAYINDPDN